MLGIVAGIGVSSVFIWLILKAIMEILDTRAKEREMGVRRLELETKALEEERLKKEAEAKLDLAMYNKEAIAKLRQEMEEQDRIIEELEEELKAAKRRRREAVPAGEFDLEDIRPVNLESSVAEI